MNRFGCVFKRCTEWKSQAAPSPLYAWRNCDAFRLSWQGWRQKRIPDVHQTTKLRWWWQSVCIWTWQGTLNITCVQSDLISAIKNQLWTKKPLYNFLFHCRLTTKQQIKFSITAAQSNKGGKRVTAEKGQHNGRPPTELRGDATQPTHKWAFSLYPWHGQIRHQLFKGPRLFSLLLVVQCDLLAELPGVGATSARGVRHGAGSCLDDFRRWMRGEVGMGEETTGDCVTRVEFYSAASLGEVMRGVVWKSKAHISNGGRKSFPAAERQSSVSPVHG